MVDVNQIGASFAQGFTGIIPQIMRYLGWLLWGIIILGGMYAAYVLVQYKFKYMYAEAGPGGIRRFKKDRIRLIKHKGADKWQLLWAKDKIEPFDAKYIYPGNLIFGYKVEKNCHTPALWNNREAGEIDIIPRDVKFWQSTEIQQAALEYQDLRAKLLPILTTLGTIIFCLILVGVTIWMTYKYIGGGLNVVADRISTIEQIAQGLGPR